MQKRVALDAGKNPQQALKAAFEQIPPTAIQGADLIYLPTFFVKKVEAIHQAAEIVSFAVIVRHKIFFWRGLTIINTERAAAIFAEHWIQLDVLSGVGGFKFYAFNINLGGGEQRERGECEGETCFFHGVKNFGAKKGGKKRVKSPFNLGLTALVLKALKISRQTLLGQEQPNFYPPFFHRQISLDPQFLQTNGMDKCHAVAMKRNGCVGQGLGGAVFQIAQNWTSDGI